ncbi:MAG TPA: DUF2231 domain-containing protein [Ignavibacteriaceae bacterium]|jgi:uncharacterized membrane protein
MEILAGFHPHVVHFPIALLITYSLVEMFGIIFKKESAAKLAYLLLCIGIFFSFFAAVTGNEALNAYRDWDETTIPVLENHQLFANLTIWYFTSILILRTILIIKKKFHGFKKYIFLLLLPVGVFFVFQAGKFGGELMHEHGVGTELSKEKSPINE